MMFRCSALRTQEPLHEEGVYRFQSIKAPTKPDLLCRHPLQIPKHLIALNEISPEIIHIPLPLFNLGKNGAPYGRGFLGIPVGVYLPHPMYNMYSHYIPIIGQMASETR